MRFSSLFSPLAALLLVGSVSVSVWAWMGRTVDLPEVPGGRLECLSYTPSQGNGSPLDPDYVVPPGLIEADMERLKAMTGCIRTYSSLGRQGDVVTAAANAGLKVLVGIWIGPKDETNEKEIGRALELSAAHPEAVRALVIGNEVLLRREMSGERLAGIIRSVKARTTAQVTYADIYEFWRRNPVVAEAVDVMTIHVLPYWDDPTPVSIDEVQAHVRRIIEGAQATFPGKTLQIGEIGWPSAGRTRGGAAPSLVNEARFLREFARQADSLGVPYNIIEAVDQPWKRLPEGTVGGYWGVLDQDRTPKFALSGPVSEWPSWRWAALATVQGAALALGAALILRRKLSFPRWLGTAGAGAATVGLLVAFAAQAYAFVLGPLAAVWSLYLGGLALLGGAIVAGACAGISLPGAKAALRYRWAVLAPVAVSALAMAVDGRHRDFLTLALLMPAIALLVWKPKHQDTSPAEGWLGLAFLVSGPLAVDYIGNREALAWAACCLLLAWGQRDQIVAEVKRLAAGGRQHEHGHHHG